MSDDEFDNVIPVEFPKYLANYKSIELEHCWDKRLANPYLSAIYKDNISWAERWYHEIRHCVNLDEDHPLLNQFRADIDLRRLLITCCQEDIKRMLAVADQEEYRVSAQEQIKKLDAWLRKFWYLHKELISAHH